MRVHNMSMCMNNSQLFFQIVQKRKIIPMYQEVIHNYKTAKKLIFFNFTCDIHTFHPYIIISSF